MIKSRPVALVGAGKVTRLFLRRLPELGGQLGPVKASSIRVATRIVNQLHAGKAVGDAGGLRSCRIVLICVPDPQVPAVVEKLAAEILDWSKVPVVLCESSVDCLALRSLQSLGAPIASLNTLSISGDTMCVVEGDTLAVREVKRTLGRSRGLILLKPGEKAVFFAGLTLASLAAHMTASSAECFRTAGIGVSQSRELAQSLGTSAIRAFVKGGQIALSSGWDEPAIQRVVAPLIAVHPELGEFMGRALRLVGKRVRAASAGGSI